MLSPMTYSLPELLEIALTAKLTALASDKTVERIWNKDPSVWTGANEANWLGWLTVADEELAALQKYRDLRADIVQSGFSSTLLMGMGGSSLCPEVLAITFGKNDFHILDSTVPDQIRSIEERLDLTKTLFIVSSKSGSTLEPNCFMQYFFGRVSEFSDEPGKQFIAITDPGSKLEAAAIELNFRQVVHGKPDVGGRFSALSPFGLAPAAMMGLDIERFLAGARDMSDACRRSSPADNPGLLLGAILGICHGAGRDKLTILTSSEIYDLGAWLEQLIAESTGKNGVAIIPVDREPKQPAVSYGNDRVFVCIKLNRAEMDCDLAELHACGHPVIEIALNDINDIGGEFFRWEFATAVAGSIMGINPFDQPDVEAAKIETRRLTDAYEVSGTLPKQVAFFETDDIQMFGSHEHSSRLAAMIDRAGVFEYLSAHVALAEESDYFALLAYVEMNAENERLLQILRNRVIEMRLAATCLGFGPRFLHSTGQAYKGGANNGVFLQITADDSGDIEIPGKKYSFGVVKAAQARGDFQVLTDRERRALNVHIKGNARSGLEKLVSLI